MEMSPCPTSFDQGGDLGQVNVYQFVKDEWVQLGQANLNSENITGNGFGTSISLSENGRILVVSAPNEIIKGRTGRVYIYHLSVDDQQWILTNGADNTILGQQDYGMFGAFHCIVPPMVDF